MSEDDIIGVQEHIEPETATFQPSYSRILRDRMKKEWEESEHPLSENTMARLSRIARTTFYRTWNSDDPDMRMDIDFAYRASQVIGGRIAAQMKELIEELPKVDPSISPEALPDPTKVQAEIIETATEILGERKETIDELRQKLAQKNDIIEDLRGQVAELTAELSRVHQEHADQNERRHTEMMELNQQHLERIDRLYSQLRDRDVQIEKLLRKFLPESGT